jgi:hypothetical protein
VRPPKHFVTLLQSMDPLLSIRYGGTIEQWVIERKAVIGLEELKYMSQRRERLHKKIVNGTATKEDVNTYKGVAEECDSARYGKRVIIFARELDRKVYDALCVGDLQRYGGYSRYADEIERNEAEEEVRKERALSAHNLEMNKECFGRFGIHDFIVRKKQTELRQHGVRSIKKLLGLTGQTWWEQAAEKTQLPSAPQLVDEYGKPIAAGA